VYDLTRSLRERLVVVAVAVFVFVVVVVVVVVGCALTELIAFFVVAIAVVVEPGGGDTTQTRRNPTREFATMKTRVQ
jgi:hypothetical protein